MGIDREKFLFAAFALSVAGISCEKKRPAQPPPPVQVQPGQPYPVQPYPYPPAPPPGPTYE